MRKIKQAYNKTYGICVLVLALVITQAGISKIKDAKAENELHSSIDSGKIMSTTSIYIKNRNTLNIYPEKPRYNIPLNEQYQNLIWELCIKNDISYELVLAIFHYESKFKLEAKNKNKNGTYDLGFSQLNNKFLNDYKNYAIKYCDFPKDLQFDVYNIDHNIRAGIGTLVHLRNYCRMKGVSEDQTIEYLCGFYNMGVYGFEKYIKQTGKIEREYSREVYKRKIKLETTHTL